MLFLQQEWGQETEDRILRDVEEHSFGEALLYEWTRGHVKHKALNEAAATSFASCGTFGDQSLKLLMQVSADAGNTFEQVLLFQDRQILKADAACQRTASERCAVLAR